MKLSRISFLFLLLFLFVPSIVSAQSSAKSWKPFWIQFSAAVKNKNKPAVKRLMVSEKDFSNGGGIETRDQWLAMLDKEKLWGLLQKSVAKGVVAHNGDGSTEKITKDRHLIFWYTGGKWRFVGVMGD